MEVRGHGGIEVGGYREDIRVIIRRSASLMSSAVQLNGERGGGGLAVEYLQA